MNERVILSFYFGSNIFMLFYNIIFVHISETESRLPQIFRIHQTFTGLVRGCTIITPTSRAACFSLELYAFIRTC